ncbi:hypothetical protein [Halorubrum sp. FL23]|uniref:hypothetical protein n=1 Tax=Halorubrum sp. FL23 TaxID=3458704 RepID=UPI00403431B8
MSDDSEPSFDEQVEEIRKNGEGGEQGDFYEKTSSQLQWGIVAGASLLGGILGAISNPTQPVFGFFVISFIVGGVAWGFATKSGRKFTKELFDNIEEMEQQQQQSVSTSTSSEPKIVCSTCGWKNPKNNNYCHDCGEKLE